MSIKKSSPILIFNISIDVIRGHDLYILCLSHISDRPRVSFSRVLFPKKLIPLVPFWHRAKRSRREQIHRLKHTRLMRASWKRHNDSPHICLCTKTGLLWLRHERLQPRVEKSLLVHHCRTLVTAATREKKLYVWLKKESALALEMK